MRERSAARRVCFVTGTRAEFGLMRSTLQAIRGHRRLQLQIIATGMHLDPSRGSSLESIRADGWDVDRVVPWVAEPSPTPVDTARNTGLATAGIAEALEALKADVVLVVGDRVEALAAATAGHLSGRAVAHVHGGDRAAGLVDDSLRHTITKLAHVHFAATPQSAARLCRLGEQPWRIHRVGSPGIDGIARAAAPWAEVQKAFPNLLRRGYALLVLHPADADETTEERRAGLVLRAVRSVGYPGGAVVVYPNNDPGAGGIVRCWEAQSPKAGYVFRRDVPRPLFLGLMRDAAVLAGNSSSGIIEAASFGTPVVDIGRRQSGREHGQNVVHVPYNARRIQSALKRLWNAGRPRPFPSRNIYGGANAGRRIAEVLASLMLGTRLLRKVIAY
jgi:UDP-hydrolysing UDP-N-acetyl-D-glucosamine 2-epimerase